MSRRAAICCTLLQTKFASTRVSKARPGLRPQDRRQIGNFRQGRAVHTRNRPVNNFVTCFVPERARDTSTGKPHRIVGRCLCRGVLAAHSEVRRIAHLGPIALRFVLVGPALFLARHFLSVINTYLYKRGIKILNGLRGGGGVSRRDADVLSFGRLFRDVLLGFRFGTRPDSPPQIMLVLVEHMFWIWPLRSQDVSLPR